MTTTNLNNVFKHIRDILRQEGITGMDSINHCLIFLISRYMDKDMCKKTGIDTKYSFNNLLRDKDGKERGDQDLYSLFYNKTNYNNFYMQFVKNLKFNNGKFKLTGVVNLKSIMKALDKLDIKHLDSQYDLVGTIYEIHLRSGTSNAMRDLGQYFTHRLVIKYMVELCKPTLVNGKVETIVDPTMGTGGFLTMAIKYLNEHHKNIDWTENIKNIYGFDLDENVKNMALLNVLLECNEFSPNTLVKQDTLHNDLKLDGVNVLQKAKVILANEPMGLKGLKHAKFCDRIKNMKINGTKAEPAFLQLFMEALDDGGRCAVVVPDGVLFNDSNQHNGTRKHLIDNFNLKKVIALNDSEFFLNTGVKTSILFFCKDGKKTREVEFTELKLDNGKLKEDSIIKVKYDKLKANNYSLFVNKYNVQEMEKIEGIEYKKLGDICEFKNGTQLDKKKMINGKYNVYGGGKSQVGYHNSFNREGFETIVCGTGAYAGYVNICKDKYWASQCFTIFPKNVNILNKFYLYYYAKYYLESEFINKQKGSTQPYIRYTQIIDLEIPVPSLKVQKDIVERLDVINDNTQTLKTNIEQFKKMLKYYVDAYTRHEKTEKIIDEVSNIKGGKRLPKGETYITSDVVSSSKYYYLQVNNILEMNEKNFNIISKENYNTLKNYKLNKNDIILSIAGTIGVVNIFNSDKNTILTENACKIVDLDKSLNDQYLKYYLISCSVQNQIKSYIKQATIPKLSLNSIKNIKIKIPSLEKQKEIVVYCDNLSDMISKMENQITENDKLMKDTMNMFMKSFSKSKTN